MPFIPPKKLSGILAAGASIPLRGSGVFARLISATGSLNIGFDLGALFPTSQGFGYECRPGDQFEQVVLENPGEVAVAYTILVGGMRVIDDRLNILVGSDYLPTTEPPTEIVGQNISTLAAGANVILDGVVPVGAYRRAAVLVDNLDAAVSLTVYDETGGIAGFILPASSRYLPLSGYVKISNDSAGVIGCAISEIWQLTP